MSVRIWQGSGYATATLDYQNAPILGAPQRRRLSVRAKALVLLAFCAGLLIGLAF